MKSVFIIGILISGFTSLIAQNTSWNGKFDNGADFLRYESRDGKYIIGTTKRDICVLDGANGNKIWSGSFKDIAEVKSCENQYFMEEAGVLFLSDKKSGKDYILCLDISNGKLLWKTDRFEGVNIRSIVYFSDLRAFAIITKEGLVALNARTGETIWTQDRFRGSLADWQYLPSSNELIMVNYKSGWGALLSGYKNQLMKVNARTGELIWETEYFGVIPTKYLSGTIISEMYVEGDRIFCLINGMQVFDLKSGNKVWHAEFDMYDHKILLGGDAYYYDGIAHPLVSGNEVYLVKFKHGSSRVSIEKRNMIDGSLIWETPLEKKADALPTLALSNGKLVAQLGGYVNVQGRDNNGSFNNYKWLDPFMIQVYDAATGAFIWKSEKLADRISNIIVKDEKIFVADEKSFYVFHINDGSILTEQKLKDLKTGEAKELYDRGNSIGIMGEKGFSLISTSGELQYNIKIKNPYNKCPIKGDNILIINDDELRVYAVSSGAEKMIYKKEKDYRYSFSPDGSYIITMSPKSVHRFAL